MTPMRVGAPIAALLVLSVPAVLSPAWAQAPTTQPSPPPAAAAPAPATPAPAAPAPAAAAPASPTPSAAEPAPAPTAAAPMTPSKPAPVAQTAPPKPQPKKHVVVRRHRIYRYKTRTEATADALNGRELVQAPVVASPPRPIAVPVPGYYYPPPAYYPPPPPAYYPPPWYWRPY